MDILQEYTIGFYDKNAIYNVYVKQNDTKRIIKFHIDNQIINIPNVTVFIDEQQPDGTYLLPIDITNDIVYTPDGILTIPIYASMVTQNGIANCDLRFVQGGNILSTIPFKLYIEASPSNQVSQATMGQFKTWIDLYLLLEKILKRILEEKYYPAGNITYEGTNVAAILDALDEVKAMNGYTKHTDFNDDIGIVETTTYSDNTKTIKTTTFNDDGSMTEITQRYDGTMVMKHTVKNSDGSIDETVTYS